MPDGRRRAAYGKGAWRSIGDGFSLLEKRELEFGAFARLQALVATKDFAAGHDSERDARLKRESFSLTERGTIRRCVENGSLRDLGRSDESRRQRIRAVALRYGGQRGGGRERLRAPAPPCSFDQISTVLRQVVRSRRRIRSGGRPTAAGQARPVTKT